MGDSNFFSAFGDKSAEDLKQFEIENERQIDNDNNKSYMTFDRDLQEEIYQRIRSYGRLGFALGTFKHDVTDNNGVVHHAGEPYILEPDEDELG